VATYTFTPSSVISAGAITQAAIAGENVNAGDLVYQDATDSNKAKKSVNSSVAQSKTVGLCLNSATAGQPVLYAAGVEVTVQPGTFASIGRLLVLSSTGGKCMDAADLVAGSYLTVIGWSTATDKLRLSIMASEKALT
jgi:hypothetical protein